MAYNVNETNGLGWTSLYWYGSGTQVEEPEMPVYEEPEAPEEISDEERAKLEVAARNAEGTKRLAQYLNRASSDGARPLSEARKAELIKHFSEANPDVPLDLGNFPLSETVSEERVSNNKGETVTVSRRRFGGNKDAAEASKRLRHNARAKKRYEKFNAPGGGRAQYEQALKNYEEEKRRFDRAQRLGQTEHLSPSVLMTSEQYLDELRYIDAESKALGDLIGFDRQAESAKQQARWDYALRQNKELDYRARNLNESISKIRGKEMLVEYYTPDGAVYLKASDGDALTQLEKEMATRGFERGKDWGKVEHFNVRGVIDAYGNVLANAPIHVAMKEGDKVAESIKQFAAANKDMNGMLLPEMFEALGIPLDEVSERANTGITVAQNIEEDRKQGKRALGKMDLSENERRRMGYGGVTLEEMNSGSGAFGKFVNWSRSINPLANLADEYGQATEAELGTPEGLEEMRRRVANGEDTLTWSERVALGLIGDPGEAILKDPEAAYNYIVNRRLKRMDAAENAELRGTTFGADVAEMTETSAMMGLEFAGINTLTGGGAVVSRAGKTLTTGQQALRGAAAMGTEAILHAPAKARQLMADKVAFNPVTNQLEVVGEGEGAVTATLKGVAAPMLEYATEMYAMRLLWNPVGRGLKRVTPTRVKNFTTRMAQKARGSGAGQWLDAVAASPGVDALRKIGERTGFHFSPMGVLLEEPILEEIPANVLSAMFNLEGTSERESGLWGQASGGATDAWDALVETVKNAPAMMTSTLLFGGGTGMAVKGTTGLINYNMSKPRVVAALRELGATDAEMKGKDKAALNDLLFEKLRNIKTDPKSHLAVYSPEEIAKMPRETLERKLREFGWADMDLSGVSEEQMRTRLLNGFKEMGNAAWTDRALNKLMTGLYAAARHGMNHSNILERLESDIFKQNPFAFDAETRERMREVMLLRSMAGSGQYRGTLAGSLMADQSLRLYASLGNEAQRALDTFEDGFVAARQTAVPTYEQIGTGAYQPSTFRQPMQESEMRNNGRGGYTDPNTGISITPIYAEGSKTPRYRVDIDPSTVTQTTIGSVDAELAKMGIRAPRVRLPMGLQNIFDNLQDARKFADRISSYSNTLKQELVTKAKAAQAMYGRVRGKNGNGIMLFARPADAPEAIRDEIMDNLLGNRQEGEDEVALMHRFKTVMGFTSAQDGKTYVFLDNHSSPYSLLQTVQHEGFHEGLLSAFLGDRKQVEAFIQELTDGRNGFPAWVSENAKKLKNPRDVEEFLAALAETMNAGPGFFHSVNRAMRKAMALNGAMAPSEMDANAVIYGAWKAQRMTPDMMPKPRPASGSFAAVSGIKGPVEDVGGVVEQKFGPTVSREDVDHSILERDRAMAKKSDKKDEAGKDEKSAKKDKPEKLKPEEEGKPEEKGEEEAPTEEQPKADDGDVKPDLGEDEGETVTDLDEEPEKGGEAPEGKPEQKEEKPEEPPTKEPEPEPAPTTPPPPKAPGKKPRKGQVTSTDELQPEEEEKPTEAAEPPKTEPEAKPEPKPEPVANGTVRNGRIAWDGKWLKPGGIRGHQGVFISDTEDGEPLAFFQTEDWGLGDKETRPMRRGAPVADHYTAAVKWKAAGMPGLEEAKAQLPVEDVDGAVSEDGYIRWEKFWLKPGTHNGEEGYFIHDERGGQAKGFYKPGAWRTKAGKERPGKVTNFVDDKLTGERVSAAYRWSKHEKMLEEQAKKQAPQPEQPHETPAPQAEPEAQEPQETPAPTPQPEQATEPEATQEAPTLKVLMEDEDGRSVHVSTKGITNTRPIFSEELEAIKEAAVNAGLAPQDAIAVGVDTNGAFVAFDEVADALERVAPTYMPVTIVSDKPHKVYVVRWKDPRFAGPITDFFDKHTVIAVVRSNNAARITKPKDWKQRPQPKPSPAPKAKPEQGEKTSDAPERFKEALEKIVDLKVYLDGEGLPSDVPFPKGFYTKPKGGVSHKTDGTNVKSFAHGGKFYVAIPALFATDNERFDGKNLGRGLVLEIPDDMRFLLDANRQISIHLSKIADDAFGTQSGTYPISMEAHDAISRRYAQLRDGQRRQAKQESAKPSEPTQQRPAKEQKPEERSAKPRKTTAATQELQEVEDLLGGLGMLRGGALPPEEENRLRDDTRSRETLHKAAFRHSKSGGAPGHRKDDEINVPKPLRNVDKKIAQLRNIASSSRLTAPGINYSQVPLYGGNILRTLSNLLGILTPGHNSNYGRFVVNKREITLRLSNHAIVPENAELGENEETVSLAVYKKGQRVSRSPLDESSVPIKEYRYSQEDFDEATTRAFVNDVADLLETGVFPNTSGGREYQTGMTREGFLGDATPPQTGMARDGVVLTAEQTVAVQNAMQKLVNASIEKDGTRTFQDFAERLFGTLGEGKRNVWEAMRPYLRNAWNQYGDLHEDLGLDEVSRAEATRIFDELESGTIETSQEQPEQEISNERTGLQPEAGQVGGTMGGQEPSRDGGDGVGSDGTGVPGRDIPESRGADVPSGLAGEQPADGVSDDTERSGGRTDEGGTDGGTVAGAEAPVQREGGRGGVREGDSPEQTAGGDGGRGQGEAQGIQPSAQEPNHLTPESSGPAKTNYVIPRDGNGGIDAIDMPRKRIEANLAALRLLKQLEKEGRQATREEQRVLSLYTGWGSLGEQLFNDDNPDWATEREELKSLLTQEEYDTARRTTQYAHYTPMDVVRGMYDALKYMGVQGENLSAFEAGLGVGRFIGGMPKSLRNTRYTGVEMDPLTASIAAQLYPQATVVKMPYQDVWALHNQFDFIVGNPPYGDIRLSDKSFPDGNGKSLHNFFIMKQIEALRPGGVAAFLVTHYFLDGKDQSARLWIHQRAQFLGAIRMPNALFKSVDANLVTDIVFFRKRLPGEEAPAVTATKKGKYDEELSIPDDSKWIYTTEMQSKSPDSAGLSVTINRAFFKRDGFPIARPGVFYIDSTVEVAKNTRYGADKPRGELVVRGDAPTREGIASTISNTLRLRMTLASAFKPYEAPAPTEQETRERLSAKQANTLGGGASHPSLLAGGHFVGADGKLYYTTKGFDGKLVAWPVTNYNEKAEKAEYAKHPRMTKARKGSPSHPAEFARWKDVQDPFTKFTPKEQDILKTLVKLREIRFDLMQEELSENADEARMSDLRKQLGAAYAAFQKAATGYAGTKKRAPALNDKEIKALIFADPASSQLLGLETIKKNESGNITEVVKGAVFSRRVNEPKWRPLDHYDKALDALTANLAATGSIDLDWIAERTDKDRATILEEIKERVFIDPETAQPVLRELYLSGDVKTKLEVAKRALNEGHEEYRRNVIALGAVIPPDIDVGDLYVPLGSPILTGEMVGRFAQSEMGFVHRDDVQARFNTLTGTWEVSVKNEPADLAGRYFAANRDFRDVMKAALNNKTLPIYDRHPDGSSTLNAEATEQVSETIRQIRDQWEMWWPTSSDATEIAKRYNERYNRIAETHYDGAFLKFQGLNPKLTPYQHQRDAVWRTIVTGNVLYNHVVGSGKTNTAILSIMEMKRMGRVRKPIVVVPNHLVEQWRNDFLAAYPGANVLATDPSDMNAENRKRYFSRIQNGDYDVIILPHSQLSRISLSADTLRELANEQLAKYREALDDMKKEGAKLTVSRIEKMVQKLEERIRAKLNALKTDETGLFFDTLGIDGIFLDEAHEFKNVPFISSVQAKGMGNPSGSNKAFDLLMKINWFRKKRAGSPVVFMTGTPVSNSLTELYLNMLYMAPDLLEKADLNSMDAFLAAFGLVDERMEVATTGQFKLAKRLRKLMNAPELMSMVRTYMDVIDADDLRGSMEAVGRTYDVPELEGGAPINVVAKRSPLQELYFGKEIAKQQKDDGTFVREFNKGSIYFRSQHMPKDLREDNMLKVTNDAMAASLDIRLRKQALIAMGVSPSELTDEALDFAGSKVNLCVAQIVTDYKRFDAVKGTQMVFCDRSIPGSSRVSITKDLEKKRKELEEARKEAEREELDPTAAFKQRSEEEESPAEAVARLEREVQSLEEELEGGFSVYDDIKQKLIAQGIPAEEIAFIHDYNTKEKKQALFDSMNEGKVRVLLGSTSRMGAGTNANKRMVSLHHLDAPWRPSDMEQRNGRIIRQGNLLMKEVPDFKVRVYQYGTERSADAFKFSTLLEKGRAFHGIFKRTSANRNVEDIGDGGLSAEQMMAQLSGSLLMPLSIEKREAVQQLERQFRNHSAKRRNLMEARDTADANTPIIEDNLARAKRMTTLAVEREQSKDNYYAGLDLRDAEGKPITLEAKTQKERIEDKQEKPLSVLLHDGATLRYRGLEWVPTRPASQNGDRYDVFVELQAFDPNDTSPRRRILASTTQYAVRGTKDDGIITRMNNTIEKAKASIPLFEGELKSNVALVEKLDKQLEEYPEAFPKAQELLEAKREFADIQRCVNADATNAAEARVTLGHYYGQKGLPVPEYEWTKPEFDKVHGVDQQTGMTRGGWEKELQDKLDKAGMTEADLSAESQAFLAAKRAHEGAMPRSRIGKMVDFVGEVITPREGETRREFIKRKGHEAAENLGKKLVDVRIPLINAVKEIVGDEVLPEDEDIATAMQLSYGRITAQHADIDADYVRPVLDILVKQGMQVSDLDIYLSAKFAPERNKMIRERAEWKDAGAGISDEEAAARLRGMQEQFTKPQMDALEKAAQIVYKMNRANLARLVESGILPQKQVEEWVKLSPHYVPLRDDLERLGAADVSGGMKHGRPFQKAVGRYSEALDSSFGWSVIQAKQGVVWAEQNRINKITVNFAKNHLSPEDYFVSKVPIKAEKVFSERKGYKQEDAVPLRLDRPAERNIAEQYLKAGYTVVRSSENRNIVWVDGGEMDRVLRVRKGTDARRTAMPQNVVARINGKRVYVFFDETKGSRGNKMGLAINRANMVHWDNRLWNTIAWLTRMKAMASTVWSVTFAARNAINDILQTSGITLMEGKYGVTKDVFKNYGQALKAFTAWRVSGQYDESTEMGAYLKEAVKQGMLTGIYGKSSNFDQTMLDSVIAPLAVLEHRTGFGKNVKDTVAYSWSQVLAATSTFSEIPEVGVRLAVYAAMRQHGATATEAAVYAREITLDYNKKGEWTPVTNTLWMFSNASIQSLARWKKAWQTGNWKSRTIGVTFLLAAGFFTQLYNIMFASLFFGGDDDELYKNIPDYAYDNSIPILLPGGKSYLTIPNRGPQAAITRIGASLANLLVGDETPTGFLSDASVVLNPAFLENANPAGSSGSFLQTVSPTILDPAIQLAENKAWTGAPVHAMDYGNSAAPKWQDGFEKTSPFSKWLARLLSDATGGDDVQGGKIDVYPEQIELVKNFIFGSIGTDFSGLSDMARGEFGNMPVMRGFVRPLPDNTHRYYEIKAEVEKNLQIMQGYAVSSREKYQRHIEQHPYLLKAKGFRRVKTTIEKLIDARRELLAIGKDTSEIDKLLEQYRQYYIDFYEGKM